MRSTPTRTCGREGVGRRPALGSFSESIVDANPNGTIVSAFLVAVIIDPTTKMQSLPVSLSVARTKRTTQYWPTFVDSSPGTPRMT